MKKNYKIVNNQYEKTIHSREHIFSFSPNSISIHEFYLAKSASLFKNTNKNNAKPSTTVKK